MKLNLTTKEILTILDLCGHLAYDDGYGKPTKIYTEKTMKKREYDRIEGKALIKLKKAINHINRYDLEYNQ